MKKQLLILITLCIATIGFSQTFIDNNITYSITSTSPNTVAVINYNISAGTDVVIPASVTPNSSSRSSSSSSASTTYDVTSIGYQAFYNMGITSIVIPNSVTSIGNDAFRDNLLTTVTLPDALTTIGNSCFSNNQLANALTIPNSVLVIEAQAFSLNFIDDLTLGNSITSIGFNAFYNNNITAITIPNSVTTIEARAFDDNLIGTVTVGSGVTSIGFKAFANNLLTDVTSLAITPPTIITGGSNDTFSSNRSTINLHIPAGTTGAYVTDPSALWTDFNSVTEDALSVTDFELVNNIKVIATIDQLQVVSPNSLRLENYTIYSIAGAKIKKGTESTIAIDAIANGIYVIELNFDNGRVTKKFIK